LVRVLNVLMGLWALYSASIAIRSIRVLSVQMVLIVLFVLLEAAQGVFLVFAPRPKVKLQQYENLFAVFGVVLLTLWAGVNVVRSPLPSSIGVGLLLGGQLLSLWASITLGRRFGLFAEVRGLCIGGPYRFFRHPMYVGYGFQYLGLALQSTHWTTWLFLTAATICQVWRAVHENEAMAIHRLRSNKKRIISPAVICQVPEP